MLHLTTQSYIIKSRKASALPKLLELGLQKTHSTCIFQINHAKIYEGSFKCVFGDQKGFENI
jgi:hypothetical protein